MASRAEVTRDGLKQRLTVRNGDFGAVSYACFFHGYMGGENNLVYESTCPSPTDPTPSVPSPTPAPVSVVPPIPSPVKTNWTLSYSDNSQGWP